MPAMPVLSTTHPLLSAASGRLGLSTAAGRLDAFKPVLGLLSRVVGRLAERVMDRWTSRFMSGVSIVSIGFRQPLRIGDLVETLRVTRLEIADGRLVLVPNKEDSQNISTTSTALGRRRVEIACGVAYASSLDHVEQVARAALEQLTERDRERPVTIYFTGFGASSIDLVAHFWIDSTRRQDLFVARSAAIEALEQAFADAEIIMPFPIRTLDFGADSAGGEGLERVIRLGGRGGRPQARARYTPGAKPSGSADSARNEHVEVQPVTSRTNPTATHR